MSLSAFIFFIQCSPFWISIYPLSSGFYPGQANLMCSRCGRPTSSFQTPHHVSKSLLVDAFSSLCPKGSIIVPVGFLKVWPTHLHSLRLDLFLTCSFPQHLICYSVCQTDFLKFVSGTCWRNTAGLFHWLFSTYLSHRERRLSHWC